MANKEHKTIYYRDELNDDFAGTNVNGKHVNEDYVYVRKGLLFRVGSFLLTYLIAVPFLFLQLKLVYGFKVKNRKVLRKVRSKAVFLYGNHTLYADAYIPQAGVIRSRKTLILTGPDATSIKGIKTLVAMLGAIPLPDTSANYKAAKKFLKALDELVAQKRVITIYPEAHIWPYYTGIRPFTSKSFAYPVNYNVPTIAMVTTYKKRKLRKKPQLIVTLSEVMMPRQDVDKGVARQLLRDEVYNFMVIKAAEPTNYAYYRYVKIDKKEI